MLFVKKSPMKRANTILAISFLVITVSSFLLFYLFLAFQKQSFQLMRFYVPLDITLLTLVGPLIYFYVRQVLGTHIRLRSFTVWIHFVAIVPSIAYAIYFMLQPTNERVTILLQNFEHNCWQSQALTYFFLVQLSCYLVICFVIVQKQLKRSRFVVYDAFKMDVSWLRTYFVLNLIIMLLAIPVCAFMENDYSDTIVALLALITQSIYIFIKTIWQTEIFKEYAIDNQTAEPEPELPKVPTLLITEEMANGYITELTKIIKKKKLYLQSDLSIQDVADLSNIPVHHISNSINTLLQKSFTDFINEFRIDDAKRILQDPSTVKFTIEKIAFDCGFGSKQNFNSVFKKIVKATPSEYRKSSFPQ